MAVIRFSISLAGFLFSRILGGELVFDGEEMTSWIFVFIEIDARVGA